MRGSLFRHFIIRWIVSILGLWIAEAIVGSDRLSTGGSLVTLVIAGLVLAILNMLLKPLLVFLSIPALLLSLGLFMLVVNGLLIRITSWLYSSFYVKNFWVAIIAGIIVGLVNYLVSTILEDFKK